MSRKNRMLRMEAHHNETIQSFLMYMEWNRWMVLVWYLPDLQESLSIVFYYIGVTLNNRLLWEQGPPKRNQGKIDLGDLVDLAKIFWLGVQWSVPRFVVYRGTSLMMNTPPP